jgi:hemoglobin-like flavoprotein
MKFALLRTIEEALPDLWNLELNMAWTEAFEEVAESIKREMNAQQLILSRISFPT